MGKSNIGGGQNQSGNSNTGGSFTINKGGSSFKYSKEAFLRYLLRNIMEKINKKLHTKVHIIYIIKNVL